MWDTGGGAADDTEAQGMSDDDSSLSSRNFQQQQQKLSLLKGMLLENDKELKSKEKVLEVNITLIQLLT